MVIKEFTGKGDSLVIYLAIYTAARVKLDWVKYCCCGHFSNEVVDNLPKCRECSE